MPTRREHEPIRRRLLAVDDSRPILRVIKDHFAAGGWEVMTAEDVGAARVALASVTPDVIVSDILMPDVDGWSFFEEVRHREETASVPFVFLSAQRERPTRLRGLREGADEFMTKPFAVEELDARICRLLDRNAVLTGPTDASGGEVLLSGSVEHLALSELLQVLSLNRRDGTVHLERNGPEGRIEFADGRLVDARVGAARGTKALFRMLSWKDATFRVVRPAGPVREPTIAAATEVVLMDGLASLDEWARWAALLPEPEARIELSHDARARLAGEDLLAAEFDLLARARRGITVLRAIDESPHPDAQVAEAMCTLLARGVIRATP